MLRSRQKCYGHLQKNQIDFLSHRLRLKPQVRSLVGVLAHCILVAATITLNSDWSVPAAAEEEGREGWRWSTGAIEGGVDVTYEWVVLTCEKPTHTHTHTHTH